jgi:hypothetical protein
MSIRGKLAIDGGLKSKRAGPIEVWDMWKLDIYSTATHEVVTVPSSIGILIPYWLPVLLIGTLSALPWLPWTFSLRTLLIATTLSAVLLGLVVWSRT